jgi:hypothetical protein
MLYYIMDDLTWDDFSEYIYIGILIIVIIVVYLQFRNTSKIPKFIYKTYKDKDFPLFLKVRWLQLNLGYDY